MDECSNNKIKCPNYWFCKNFFVKDCRNLSTCFNCDLQFGGKIEISEYDRSCEDCFCNTLVVIYRECRHETFCPNCFIERHKPIVTIKFPEFPYPEMQDDYENYSENNSENYPLIKFFHEYVAQIKAEVRKVEEERHQRTLCPECHEEFFKLT